MFDLIWRMRGVLFLAAACAISRRGVCHTGPEAPSTVPSPQLKRAAA